ESFAGKTKSKMLPAGSTRPRFYSELVTFDHTAAPRWSRSRQQAVSAARRCLKAAVFSIMVRHRGLCFIAELRSELASIKLRRLRAIDCAAKPQCHPMPP